MNKMELNRWLALSLGIVLLTGCGKTAPEDAEETTAGETAPVAAETAVTDDAPAMDDTHAAAPAETVDAAREPEAPAEPAVPVASVNGQEISEADVQKVLDTFLERMGGQIPPSQLDEALPEIRERILEELIMRQIMADAVAKEGISLSDAEFEEIKAEMTDELPPGMTLEAYMEEIGADEDEMRQQMTVRKMIIARAESVEQPTSEEIRAFYDENQDGFSQGATVEASHILIKFDPEDDEAAKAAKRERIEALREQIIGGADFAELASENSDCPSATSGGSLGTFGRGDMVPAFEDAAFSQPVGSVGDVVETRFGYHLIKVASREAAKTMAFEEVSNRIHDILYSQSQQEAVREFVDGLRESADVQRFDEPQAESDEEDAEMETLELIVEDDMPAPAAPESVETVPAAPEVPDAADLSEAAAEAAAEVVAEAAASAEAGAAAVEEKVEAAEEAVLEAEVAAEEAIEEADASAEAAMDAVEETTEAAAETALETEAVAEEAMEEAEASVEAAMVAVEEASESSADTAATVMEENIEAAEEAVEEPAGEQPAP